MKILVFVLICFVTFFCVGAFSLQQQQQFVSEEGDVIVEEGNNQINKHIRNKRFLFGNDQSSASGYSNYGGGNSGYGGGYNGYNGGGGYSSRGNSGYAGGYNGGGGYSSSNGYSGNGLGYSNFGSGLSNSGGGYNGGIGYGNIGGVDGYYGENLNYFPYGTRTYPIRGFRIIRNSYGERLAYPYY
uniref:Uncharacterized protein n=1 Tax=Panagrolaimus sp. PS1159 TaxID=55785 RepID=A0AC35GGX2_9BILA